MNSAFGQSTPSVSMNSFNLHDNEATIIITSPRRLDKVCLRPLLFNFNDSLVDEVSENISAKISNTQHKSGWSSNTLQSILPAANGIPVNCEELSHQWTFVLMINIRPSRAVYGLAGPTQRLLATGVFIDEPLNPSTMQMHKPALNPNAMLQILHCTTMNIQEEITAGSGHGRRKCVNNDMHNITQQSDAYYNPDTYVINNQKIRESDTYGEDSIVHHYGAAQVSKLPEALSVPTYEGSPKQTFNNLTSILESAVNTQQSADHIDNLLMKPASLTNPYSDFINTVDTNVMNSNLIPDNIIHTLQAKLNTKQPIIFKNLLDVYPSINVIPFKIDPTGMSCLERPQNIMNVQNTMSALLVNCLNTIVTNCGLSEIMFRYDSYNGDVNNPMERGCWDVGHVCELVQGSENSLRASLQQFRTLMTQDVFPILLSVGGEFSLMCKYDVTGETMISIQFLDSSPLDGYYVHQNKLGGLLSPHIGTIDDLMNNSSALNGLMGGVSVNLLGVHPRGNNLGIAEEPNMYDNSFSSNSGFGNTFGGSDIFNTPNNANSLNPGNF